MEGFSPCAEENTLGLHLMDRYPDRVQFDNFNPKDEDMLSKHRFLLNMVYAQAKSDHIKVCCGMDGSVPLSRRKSTVPKDQRSIARDYFLIGLQGAMTRESIEAWFFTYLSVKPIRHYYSKIF